MKKVQIVFPWMVDVPVGQIEQHYGVPFDVVEAAQNKSTLVAELPDKEAKAMIDAGRATLYQDPVKRAE